MVKQPPHESAKSSASQSLEAPPPRPRSPGKSQVLRSQSLADSNCFQHNWYTVEDYASLPGWYLIVKYLSWFTHRHIEPEGETDPVYEADFRAGQLSVRTRAAKHR